MPSFAKESLELLREKIDLVEVLSPYIKLQRAGAAHKALCPFHEERSPSFVIQKGDRHYHCFGCGAHGDAIQFLMTHLRMSFTEAVEMLAEKFQVPLELARGEEAPKGPPKAALKETLEQASQFFQFCLLHTPEGHAALEYLYDRGIDLPFVCRFSFGLAPKDGTLFLRAMQMQNVPFSLLEACGLAARGREFFSDRITIPIHDGMGSVIGFSARKYKPETFGGKYINTPETPLFKKSKILFGLPWSRKQIAKEKKALIVEGQIDALRLIDAGFAWTVAGQGTAFGEEHAKELLYLGVRQVFLAFDGDTAGKEAAVKVGHLFQKEGIDVRIVPLSSGEDPDQFLQEKGPKAWEKKLEEASDYLVFLVEHLSSTMETHTPAGKTALVQEAAKRIREWDHPLMIHESLRKLARLTQTPESILSLGEAPPPQVYIPRAASVSFSEVDPDRVLEADLLRWLFLMAESCPEILVLTKRNLGLDHFRHAPARALYERYLQAVEEGGKAPDLLTLAIDLESAEQRLFLAEVLQKRVNRDKALSLVKETIQKMLERHWMHQREEIKRKIYSGKCKEEEVLELAKQFDALKRERPQLSEEE